MSVLNVLHFVGRLLTPRRLRRASTSTSTEMKPTEASPAKPSTKSQELESKPSQKITDARPAVADNMQTSNPPQHTSGLVNYGSDEDDDW